MILGIALSPSLDVTYLLDDFTPGQIHRPVSVIRMAGGKALNASRAAATIGADVAAVAVLGGENGDVIAGELSRSTVHLARVNSSTPSRSCISIHSRASGELTEIYEPAVEVTPSEFDDVVAAIDRMPNNQVGWLILAGGLPASLSDDAVPNLIDRAHALGWRVAVDTHGEALRQAVEANPDLIKVNREEALELIAAVDDAANLPNTMPIREVALAVQERTRGLVAITEGVHGAVATSGHRVLRARLRHPRGQFAVGSGDSFLGGLVASLQRGSTLIQAMRIAAACGTANALVPGSARFERASVDSLAPQVEITED